MISKYRPSARAVDEDVSWLEYRPRVLCRDVGLDALHGVRPAGIDEIAEGALDAVEWAEPECPLAKQGHEVRRNQLSECVDFVELCWIEDGLDVVSIDEIGAVALD